ncbi:hypothetical protein ALP46_200084 [Pseudomonas amygdali pv. myricae]|nr:hypothetical protein ALP46_200084 [Pseudomonas amygdali pv. myricae]
MGGASAGFAGEAVAGRFVGVVLSDWALGAGLAAGCTRPGTGGGVATGEARGAGAWVKGMSSHCPSGSDSLGAEPHPDSRAAESSPLKASLTFIVEYLREARVLRVGRGRSR